jgi:hypothetical protein
LPTEVDSPEVNRADTRAQVEIQIFVTWLVSRESGPAAQPRPAMLALRDQAI